MPASVIVLVAGLLMSGAAWSVPADRPGSSSIESIHQESHGPQSPPVGINNGQIIFQGTPSSATLDWWLVDVALAGAAIIAFAVLYKRYAAILTRRGPDECAAYDDLRQRLLQGGLPPRVYADRLKTALNAVDRFFGDAGMADRTLFPHAFGLRTPAPLWTAPAFDRCLLLALLYPIAIIFVIWSASGHTGLAEHSLGLNAGVPWPARSGFSALVAFQAFAFLRFLRASGWGQLAWLGAVGGATVGAAAIVGVHAAGFAGIVVFTADMAVSNGAFGGAGVLAFTVTGAFGIGITAAINVTAALGVTAATGAFVGGLISGAASLAVVIASLAVFALSKLARENSWEGRFQMLFLLAILLICYGTAYVSSHSISWPILGPLVLFLGLFTLINAPFDWASLGLTRALLRRGLEQGGWWPFLLAVVDAVGASGIIAMLIVVAVLGIQAFDDLAAHTAGDTARILPLNKLFDGIEAQPAAPQYCWAYALVLSTMIPSLLNLMIGGTSLLRGIPLVTERILREMPQRGPPRAFERTWMALLLTLQIFLGGAIGVAVQALIVYIVIWWVLPPVGLDLLSMARAVAAPDLPGQAITALLGPARH